MTTQQPAATRWPRRRHAPTAQEPSYRPEHRHHYERQRQASKAPPDPGCGIARHAAAIQVRVRPCLQEERGRLLCAPRHSRHPRRLRRQAPIEGLEGGADDPEHDVSRGPSEGDRRGGSRHPRGRPDQAGPGDPDRGSCRHRRDRAPEGQLWYPLRLSRHQSA